MAEQRFVSLLLLYSHQQTYCRFLKSDIELYVEFFDFL